jgi:hypothetical protein
MSMRWRAALLTALAVLGSLTAMTSPTTPAAGAAPTSVIGPVFPVYYLWWTGNHWHDRLGPNYPYGATRSPLPAALDATSCGTRNRYTGNTLTDVSQHLAYDQTQPSVIDADVRLAATLGVTGFAVNWNGTGQPTQTPTDDADNQRLEWMFQSVRRINAEGTPFHLILNYKGSANVLPPQVINNDLRYLTDRYAGDPAFDHTYSPLTEVIWAGSWKYTDDEIAAVRNATADTVYLIGDEKPTTWNAARTANLDGASYYWSSQNPYKNPSSFRQLAVWADLLRAQHKTWIAPLTPGYNAQLLYGTNTCVPRNNGQTMGDLYTGNARSHPDGWLFISWNEIAEGSYIVPLTRYGTRYTDRLRDLIATGH